MKILVVSLLVTAFCSFPLLGAEGEQDPTRSGKFPSLLPQVVSEPLGKGLLSSLARIDGSWSQPAEVWARVHRYFPEIGDLLSTQGIQFNIIEKETKTGSIRVFEILPVPHQSPLNDLADELFKTHLGLKLIYDPYHLAISGAAAFFSPKENILGISHQSLVAPYMTESLKHELFHAQEFVHRLTGVQTCYHGIVQLSGTSGGHWVSEKNRSYYIQFMSFEEPQGYLISVRELLKQLNKLRNGGTPQSQSSSHDQIEALLDDLRFAADVGYSLSLQTEDVCKRAAQTIEIPDGVQFYAHRLFANSEPDSPHRDVVGCDLFIQSYSREFHSGVGTTVEYPGGAKITYYLVSDSQRGFLEKNNLLALKDASREGFLEGAGMNEETTRIFAKILQALPLFMERVDMERTDFNSLSDILLELELLFEKNRILD